MTTPTMVFVATCDLSAQVRGRSAPLSAEPTLLRSGTGWVPANLGLTCFGELADAPFDSTGDLRLIPDESTRIDLPGYAGAEPLRLYLGTQTELDGTPFAGDARAFAVDALNRLEEKGLRLVASFEHEFVLEGLPETSPFGLDRYRAGDPFGTELVRLLDEIGFEPDTWLAEYGQAQYEITVKPAPGIVAADRAVVLRELVRDLAVRHDLRATFAPMAAPGGTGSGVHVHLSLLDAAGEPVLFDASRPGRLSALGAAFSAGIVSHAPAMVALTAPSPISYLRLGEHHWSAAGAYLAERDREALLRICPTTPLSATPEERQFNLEFRAADATANPWLVLGLLIRAGLQGLEDGVEEPVRVGAAQAHPVDPSRRLPASNAESLAALAADAVVRSWLPELLVDTFLAIRRAEAEASAGWDDAERCRRISRVY